MTDITIESLTILGDDTLVALLASKQKGIADSAAHELHLRSSISCVANAVLSGAITNKSARQRALNLLNWWGARVTDRESIYEYVLENYTCDLFSNVFFGIVFSRYKHMIPKLLALIDFDTMPCELVVKAQLAIQALKANNPAIYSPGYRDTNCVWPTSDPSITKATSIDP